MAALLVLFLLGPVMLAIGVLIRLTSQGPALFRQWRVGRNGGRFQIYKFRTMIHAAGGPEGPGLTRAGDRRITPVGMLLRRAKLDELPQLINVLRGEMSLVGPRPKLPQYEAILNMPYRPGITGAATLAFRHEEEILRHIPASQLDQFYSSHVKTVKARMDVRYMCRASLASDLRMILATLLSCLLTRRPAGAFPKPVLVIASLRADALRDSRP